MKDQELNFEGIEKQTLRAFTEKAYLDYSMYVILDRALPHIGDGLKPVQRRIIYAMSELGFGGRRQTQKIRAHRRRCHRQISSARRFRLLRGHGAHGAGFSYRYPLVDGQGNWGSPDDPKSFAAMRYTESRLTRYATLLLQRTRSRAPWTGRRISTAPSKSPRCCRRVCPICCSMARTGIAVGMATDIPPHNLREVVKACIALLEDPEGQRAQVDAPSSRARICRRGRKSSRRGANSCRCTKRAVVVTARAPRMKSSTAKSSSQRCLTRCRARKVLEQIANQMRQKKFPMVPRWSAR